MTFQVTNDNNALFSAQPAVASNGVIGRDGQLPWRLPEDLKHFKRLTLGHPVIMGRRTWEAPGEIADGDDHRRRQAVTRRSRGMRTAHSISSTMAIKAMA